MNKNPLYRETSDLTLQQMLHVAKLKLDHLNAEEYSISYRLHWTDPAAMLSGHYQSELAQLRSHIRDIEDLISEIETEMEARK